MPAKKQPPKPIRGRPTKPDAQVKLSIGLTPAQLERLDELRGTESRGQWIARVAGL